MEYDEKKQMLWLIGMLILTFTIIVIVVISGGWNLIIKLVFYKIKSVISITG